MIDIKFINIENINKNNYQLLKNMVSEEKRKQASRFYFINDAKRCICGELLLKYSLLEVYDELIDIEISYNKFGKPYISNKKNFFYNISHSGKWVVLAYGDTEIGIDIEEIKDGREEIADSFFTDEEKSFIYKATGRERSKRFTKVWTLKESYIKYLGTGLSTRLNSFTIPNLNGTSLVYNGVFQKKLKLKSYYFDKEYYFSICSTKDVFIAEEVELANLLRVINEA